MGREPVFPTWYGCWRGYIVLYDNYVG